MVCNLSADWSVCKVNSEQLLILFGENFQLHASIGIELIIFIGGVGVVGEKRVMIWNLFLMNNRPFQHIWKDIKRKRKNNQKL